MHPQMLEDAVRQKRRLQLWPVKWRVICEPNAGKERSLDLQQSGAVLSGRSDHLLDWSPEVLIVLPSRGRLLVRICRPK